METARTIRETLLYNQRYRRQTMVIKLGSQVVRQAEKLEILSDIVRLKLSDIRPIITHANPEVKPQEWISLDNMGLSLDLGSLDDIEHYTLGKIPVVYCQAMNGLSIDAVVAQVAIELNAIKLIYATYRDGVFDATSKMIHQMTIDQAQEFLNQGLVTGGIKHKVEAAIMACKAGVPRVHIINGLREGALLKEIFTSAGVGTMIYGRGAPYQFIQRARPIDAVRIIHILKTAELETTIVFEDIVKKIKQFVVYQEDEQVHGCMMLAEQAEACEIAYVATSTPYEPQIVMQELIKHAIDFTGLRRKIKYIYLEASKNDPWLTFYPWFYQLGFEEKTADQCDWHPQDTSQKLWVKTL